MELSKTNRNIIQTVLVIGAFLASLGQSLLTSALPRIINDFNISATLGQLLTTSYIMVLGVVTSTTAYLINNWNTKRLFVYAMGIFLLGCVLSVIAPNFYFLLISRIIQACGAGVLLPLLQVVSLYLFPVEKRGEAMGIVGLTVGFAPAIGPTLSGIIVDLWGWKYIFYLLIIVSVFVIIAGFFSIKDFKSESNGHFDLFSAGLYGIGFCGIMMGITNLNGYGLSSSYFVVPFAVGVISLLIFVRRQLRIETPMLRLSILKDKTFSISVILVCIVYLAMMSGTLIIPMYVQLARKMSATISGLVLLPGSLIVALFNPIAGKLFDKLGSRYITLVGMVLMFIGNTAFVLFDGNTSMTIVAFMYLIRMIGNTMLLSPLIAYGASKIARKDISHGTAIVNSARQMIGSLGSSILIIIVTTVSLNGSVDVHGINVSFGVQSILILIGFIISIIFIKPESEKDSNLITQDNVS